MSSRSVLVCYLYFYTIALEEGMKRLLLNSYSTWGTADYYFPTVLLLTVDDHWWVPVFIGNMFLSGIGSLVNLHMCIIIRSGEMVC